jgi:DNA-binding MarR family transcriptional regulator
LPGAATYGSDKGPPGGLGRIVIGRIAHSEVTTQSRQGSAGAVQTLDALFELSTRLVGTMDRKIAERGLTHARAEVLWRLARLGPIIQRHLSLELACTPRNVTDLVDSLERAGFVTRGRHPTDRRATLVALTQRGAATEAAIRDDYRGIATDLILDLDPSDLGAFTSIVNVMVSRLKEAGDR